MTVKASLKIHFAGQRLLFSALPVLSYLNSPAPVLENLAI